MPRLAAPTFVLVLPLSALIPALAVLALPGCSRRAKTGSVSDAAAGIGATASVAAEEAVFSAPIAATMVGRDRVVAGLVAAAKKIRVRATRDGRLLWTRDVFDGASWAPDVDLRLLPAGDGVAVVWRSPAANGSRALVRLGPGGEPLGETVPVGATVCSTADGVAWVDPKRAGPVRVRAMKWGDQVLDAATLPADRDAALVCGDHVVFVLGDGDDDLVAASFVPGAAAGPFRVAIRDADFGEDEEREHEAYTAGDSLGLVRIGASGAISTRDVPRSGPATPWRTLKHKLSQDDDVVAVDGDASAVLVVFTRDADDACPGTVNSSAVSVHALRIDRAAGTETIFDLSSPDCDASPGPFWIAHPPAGPSVAWVERSGKVAPNTPPVRRLAVRLLGPDGIRPTAIDVAADAVVDGSCSDAGCFAAALVRPPAADDGMLPEAIQVLAYP
jgi:hypothetical protein